MKATIGQLKWDQHSRIRIQTLQSESNSMMVFQFSKFFILYFIYHENIFHLKFKRQRMEEKLRWFYFCFCAFRSIIDEIYIQSHFKIDGNKLVNEQRDRKTGDLQVTASREIVDGKMVEVILSFFFNKKKKQ